MNKDKFKKEFNRELVFFGMIASRDLENGFTVNQVEDELIKYSSSFYGARIDYDVFALKKAYFISKYAYQIIKGDFDSKLLDELCNEIEEENRIRVK